MPVADAVTALELDKHRPKLLKFAMLQLRNATHAEDVVQETLLAALQAADGFAGQSSVRTWLVGILKHKIVDHIRRTAREQPLAADQDETSLEDVDARFKEDGHFQTPPADWGDPESALSQQRFFQALERCMERLPKKTARAFMMREVLGQETEEICKLLGTSPSNCWVMLYRARMVLRECLETSWFGPAGPR